VSDLVWWSDDFITGRYLLHCRRLLSVGGDRDALSVLYQMEDLEDPAAARLASRYSLRMEAQMDEEIVRRLRSSEAGYLLGDKMVFLARP